MNAIIQREFSKWLNGCLSLELPINIKSFNFNIYEGESEYHIQLIGSGLSQKKMMTGHAMKYSQQERISL